MYQIIALREEINQVASRLIGMGHGVFEEASLGMPKVEPAELGFLRCVSWLFVLYHEVGKVGVVFLKERFAAYDVDPCGDSPTITRWCKASERSCSTISTRARDTTRASGRYVRRGLIVSLVPRCQEQTIIGSGALDGLLVEAVQFLNGLLSVVRAIEKDESRGQICREWLFRIRRYHPPHAFDELISRVAADMGRDGIDPIRLRGRFYDRWVQDLSLLQADYEFEVEARKLIERAILTETILTC